MLLLFAWPYRIELFQGKGPSWTHSSSFALFYASTWPCIKLQEHMRVRLSVCESVVVYRQAVVMCSHFLSIVISASQSFLFPSLLPPTSSLVPPFLSRESHEQSEPQKLQALPDWNSVHQLIINIILTIYYNHTLLFSR